ncbi:MAG: hypothetical protein ABI207_04275 [Crocinitomicaceae bacterium]
MENDQLIDNENTENRVTKPPTFLIVLAVLSFLYMSSGLFASATALFTGPVSQSEMEQIEVGLSNSVNEMNKMGQPAFAGMFETVIKKMHYTNEYVFYKQNALALLVALIGITGIVFMLKLKKMGFHIYIIYCLATVGIMYVVYPINLILNIEVYVSLFFSALFIFLYSRNLKVMQ